MSLPTSQKEKIVKLVLGDKISVSDLSKEYGVARKTIYSWVKIYRTSASRNKKTALKGKYVKGKDHPRYAHSLFEEKLVRLVKKNPGMSATALAKSLKAGRHIVYSILKDLALTTEDSRLAFSRIYAFPGILDNDIKLSVVHSALNKEKTITFLAKENHVARKTIYEWIREYREKGKIDTDYVKGFDHPKAYSEGKVEIVLNAVIENPALSIHALAKSLNLSSHGVFNVLQRHGLTHSGERFAYAASGARVKKPVFGVISNAIKSLTSLMSPNMLPAPPPAGKMGRPSFSLLKQIFAVFLATSTLTFGSVYLSNIVFSGVTNPGKIIGLAFACIALFFGSFFFLYSLKYYISLAIVLSYSQRDVNAYRERKKSRGIISWLLGDSGSSGLYGKTQKAVGLEPNLDNIHIRRHPFVSVQIPFYNEKNVVRRSIEAAVNLNYPNYEVILCDDSTDETSKIIHDYQTGVLFKNEELKIVKGDGWELTSVEVKPGVTLKHLHRTTRHGFKGAALELARTLVDPKTEFISIFDADFVPYPDSLELFLKYFKAKNGMDEDYTKSNVAAVQGYQWHVLNKSENWITRGVRSEYAGSYVIERSGIEIYGGLKQISGSVYMIRRDVLDEIGWGESITEDFELTLKLYNAGYKVLYTPYIQAPAECVSTIRRFIKQRMRWAEGHSFNVKKMFKKLMLSPKLTAAEKGEFLYLSPYYLQAFIFLIGTFSWLISETIFRVRLPFWTELWGWSLILTNMVALPLVNTVGMFMEESQEKDYTGIGSFVALCYLVVPFQAYAAVKGFLEKEEGTWFRTPKTGRITDVLSRNMFYRFVERFLPGNSLTNSSQDAKAYLALNSANNQFNNFTIKTRKGRHWVGRSLISIVLLISTTITSYAPYIEVFMDSKGTSQGTGILSVPAVDEEVKEPSDSAPATNENAGKKSSFRLVSSVKAEGNSENVPADTSFDKKVKNLELQGPTLSFMADEAPSFEVIRKKGIWEKIITIFAKDKVGSVDIKIVDNEGVEVKAFKVEGGNALNIELSTADLLPGKYTIIAKDTSGSSIVQDFTWGVLAINTNKSIYTPNETAQIALGVLDEKGEMVCNAEMTLLITSPGGVVTELSTANGKIIVNKEECSGKAVTLNPDYKTDYKVGEAGGYQMVLTAVTGNGSYTVKDSFEVRDGVPFDVERISATRIYPGNIYPVIFKVVANKDYQGIVEEKIPEGFVPQEMSENDIKSYLNINKDIGMQVTLERDRAENQHVLRWFVDWKAGGEYYFGYTYQAPLVSPAFYLLGPLWIDGFQEARQWQIASDAAPTLNTLLPTAYSSQTGTAWTNTTVGNIDEGIAAADGLFIVAGTNSTSSIFYSVTDTPSDFVKMINFNYDIRYRITPLSNDTEALYVQVFKSDKTTALTNEMLVVSTTTALTIRNKGSTAFTGVSTTATKTDWDGAYFRIRTTHSKAGGADNSIWSIDGFEMTGTYNAPPTTVLNSPTNGQTVTSNTPTLNFTGTDPNAEAVEYNVQVDTSSSFNSTGGNPLLSKFSTTDAGFTAGHPYASGTAIDYTLQSALSPGTYYWRVSATDPSGTDTYGSWSSVNSFIVPKMIQGNIYQSGSESSTYGTAVSVSASVNNGTPVTLSNQTGSFTFTTLTFNSGDRIAIYIDGASVNATAFTVIGSVSISTMHLYIGKTAIYNHNSGNTTNANICSFTTYPGTNDRTYSCPGGNVLAATSSEGSDELHIAGGYAPGANVNAGKLHIASGGTYTGASETLTISGTGTGTSRPFYINGGTFTPTTNTVVYTGGSTVDLETTTYYNLTVNGTGPFNAQGTINVGRDLTVASGTLAMGTNSLNVGTTSGGGNIKVAGTISQTGGTTTVKTVGSGSSCIGATGTNCAGTPGTIGFYNLTIGDGSTSFTASIGGTTPTVTVGNDLNITANAALSATGTLRVAGNWTKSATGAFTANTGTVVLNAVSDTTQIVTGATAFYNLTATTGDRIIVFAAGTTFTINTGGTFTATGTSCSAPVVIRSSTTGTRATITNTGSVSLSYIDIQDIAFSGAVSAGNSVDSGNNSNITIAANACAGASTNNQAATGYSFQRKVFYDSGNNVYWTFFHDGSQIEVRYSTDGGTTWNVEDDHLVQNTNDFSIWEQSVSGTYYVFLAAKSGDSIILRRGVITSGAIAWDSEATPVTALTGTGSSASYSYTYVTADSSGYLWVGARYYNGTNYVYKAVKSNNLGSSTWTNAGFTWGDPSQISNDQTDANVYGNIVSIGSQNMYATFVKGTAIQGCKYTNSLTAWTNSAGTSSCKSSGDTEAHGSPVNIDDASDFGSTAGLPGSGRQVVRNKAGVLYSFLNDGGNCEMWKSADGTSWAQQQSGTAITCTADRPVSMAIDGNQGIHVAYINGNSLKYRNYDTATDAWTGSEENIYTISGGDEDYIDEVSLAVDNNSVPHIIVVGEDIFQGMTMYDLIYSNRVGSGWDTTPITIESLGLDVCSRVDLTIDSEHKPQISYVTNEAVLTVIRGNANDASSFSDTAVIDSTISSYQPTTIAVDTLTGNTWVSYVDAGGSIALGKHVYGASWSTWTTVTTKTGYSYLPSLAIAGSSDIYVFYQDNSTDQKIAYDVYDSNAASPSWAGEVILETPATGVDFRTVKAKWSFKWNNYGANKIDYLYSDGTDVYWNYLYLRRSPTNIDNASDFGSLTKPGVQVLRSSTGDLYSVLNDGGNCEMWKSTNNGDTWSMPDSTNVSCDSGKDVSAAIDSTDTIHIVFLRDPTINYATFTNNTWSSVSTAVNVKNSTVYHSTISIDSNDQPHIAFSYFYTTEVLSQYAVGYTNKLSGSWKAPVDIGNSPTAEFYNIQITMDKDDKPEVTYQREGTSALLAAIGNANSATSFTPYIIDSTANSDATKNGCSIAVDSSGNTWIAYLGENGTDDYITLFKHDYNTDWATAGNWHQYADSKVGYEPSLAIVASSEVSVLYADDQSNIVYDKYNGSAWSGETLLEQKPNLQDAKVRWSYLNNNDSTTKLDYLFSDGTDVFYNRVILGSGSVPGTQDSIDNLVPAGLSKNISTVADGSGNVHILYIKDDTTDYVAYKTWNGTSWDTTPTSIESNANAAYVTLSRNSSNGDLWACWIDTSTNTVKNSTHTTGWSAPATWQTPGTTVTNLSSNYSSSAIFSEWTLGAAAPFSIGDALQVPEFTWLFLPLAPFLPLLMKLKKKKAIVRQF